MTNSPKFIFVTGGVMSGLGKGIVSFIYRQIITIMWVESNLHKNRPLFEL